MDQLKVCSCCNVEKAPSAYSKDKKSKTGFSYRCKECSSINSKHWRLNNSEYVKNKKKKYYQDNRITILSKQYEYKDKKKAYMKSWRKKNREKIRLYARTRYANSIEHRLADLCRRACRRAFDILEIKKGTKTEKLLGCTYEELKLHIEQQFTSGMSWELVGQDIHIDHIKPLASAKSITEIEELCHYKNLQPLWAKDNWSKGARL